MAQSHFETTDTRLGRMNSGKMHICIAGLFTTT